MLLPLKTGEDIIDLILPLTFSSRDILSFELSKGIEGVYKTL